MSEQGKNIAVGVGILALLGAATALIIVASKNKNGGGKGGNNPLPGPPPENDYASPGKDYIPGKTVYATTGYTKTWTEPVVDEGWFWGSIGGTKQYDIPMGNIAGWVVDGPIKGSDPDDSHKWYKIRVYTIPGMPALEYGFVREDVIEIK